MKEREQHYQYVVGKGLTKDDEQKILDHEKQFFNYPELTEAVDRER